MIDRDRLEHLLRLLGGCGCCSKTNVALVMREICGADDSEVDYDRLPVRFTVADEVYCEIAFGSDEKVRGFDESFSEVRDRYRSEL